MAGKLVDRCEELCSATNGCSMFTHGTHGGVKNNCVLCTGDGTLGSADWTTVFIKKGKIGTTVSFETVLALDLLNPNCYLPRALNDLRWHLCLSC